MQILPSEKELHKFYPSAPEEYSGYKGYFKTLEEAKQFITSFQKATTNLPS
jgi:hypothetical protein